VTHVEEERRELAKDVHRLARLGVRLMIISDGYVTVQNGAESNWVTKSSRFLAVRTTDSAKDYAKLYINEIKGLGTQVNLSTIFNPQTNQCVTHVEEERRELAKDVHRLARLGVRLMIISDGYVTVQNGAESNWVTKSSRFLAVRTTDSAKDYAKLYINEIKGLGTQVNLSTIFNPQTNQCVTHVEEERRELAKDVHRLARLGVRLMIISDGYVTVQNGAESNWVTKSSRFLAVRTTDSAKDYAKLYINEIKGLGTQVNLSTIFNPQTNQCVTHVEEERRELAKDVHRLARLGVRLMIISDGYVTVQNGAESNW
ncbi:hypothetical protein MTR67_025647, partial [Solanum verrucosum]